MCMYNCIHLSLYTAVIGFLASSYNVSEDDQVVGVEIGVLSGTTDRAVVVEITAISGSAVGTLDPV